MYYILFYEKDYYTTGAKLERVLLSPWILRTYIWNSKINNVDQVLIGCDALKTYKWWGLGDQKVHWYLILVH